MRPVKVGATGVYELTVGPEHLASKLYPGLPDVLATAVMIEVMECAASEAIAQFLEPDEVSVGIEVAVRHLAATPLGQKVRANAEIISVEGRRVEFKVNARDQSEEIGAGTHRRAVVKLAQFLERLEAKKRK
jgi:fluoroacetyl-CoA thioesterase